MILGNGRRMHALGELLLVYRCSAKHVYECKTFQTTKIMGLFLGVESAPRAPRWLAYIQSSRVLLNGHDTSYFQGIRAGSRETLGEKCHEQSVLLPDCRKTNERVVVHVP